jgi:hypothetical protein
MELSAIYKESKLYKVSPDAHSGDAALVIPAGFDGTVVLYENEADIALSPDMSSFLSKVIEAGMKLNPAQVLTANMNHTDVTLQKLSEHVKAKTVVIFGTNWLATLKNANIQRNEIVKLYGMKILITDTLEIINSDDAAKKAFWVQLKKLF